jgi:hypothetical protein
MVGESHLDRQMRDRANEETIAANTAKAERKRADDPRVRAMQSWQQHDEVELKEALDQWNAKLEEQKVPHRFSFNHEAHSGGDLLRAFVLASHTETRATAHLEIRVTEKGVILAIREGRACGTYPAGQVTAETWTPLFAELDNELAR